MIYTRKHAQRIDSMLRSILGLAAILLGLLIRSSGTAYGLSISIGGTLIKDCIAAPQQACPADAVLDTNKEPNKIAFNAFSKAGLNWSTSPGTIVLSTTLSADGKNTSSVSFKLANGDESFIVTFNATQDINAVNSVNIIIDSGEVINAPQGFADMIPPWKLTGEASGEIKTTDDKPLKTPGVKFTILGYKGQFAANSSDMFNANPLDDFQTFLLMPKAIMNNVNTIHNIQATIEFAFDPNVQKKGDSVRFTIQCPTPELSADSDSCTPGLFDVAAATTVPSPSALILLLVGIPVIVARLHQTSHRAQRLT